MAKILISYHSTYSNFLYKGLANVLCQEGNDVMLINWVGNCIQLGEEAIDTSKENYSQKIFDFSPDIIFSFNNTTPLSIVKKLHCPILIFEADMPYMEGYCTAQKCLKEVLSFPHTYYISSDSASKTILDKYISCSFPEDRYLFLPVATCLTSQKLPYSRNIFFVGANWNTEFTVLSNMESCNEKFATFYESMKTSKIVDILNKNPKQHALILSLIFYFSGQERLNYLDQLSDLGLEIYGRYWENVGWTHNMSLYQSCKNKVIFDDSISYYYNSSKISINFSHPQAINSFSFRVMDIMASNSCLLTEDKLDFHLLFDKYLSKSVLEAVLYKNRFDMREKAIRLLQDNALRETCVHELNIAIEKNGRWIHRLKMLQNFLNIKLTHIKCTPGILTEYEGQPTPTIRLNKCSRNIFNKNILNSIALFWYGIPGIDKLFPVQKQKLIRSIVKHNDPEFYTEYNNYRNINKFKKEILQNLEL